MENSEKIESSKYLVLGNVDAGKSSFIGVMEKNILDDGNGYARSLITKIPHEIQKGRTTNHSHHYMVKNNEITTLIDLCGHEKYLKTTIFGITGLFGDYGIVVIGSNMGVVGTTNEHITLLVSNKIPFIIVVTKIDICPENIMEKLKSDIGKIAKRCRRQLLYFDEQQNIYDENGNILDCYKNIINVFQQRQSNIIPVIMTSNKSGHNIDFTRDLLTSIKSKPYLERKGIIENNNTNNYSPVMYIDSIFSVHGIGIVLSGTVKYGELHINQKVYIGPINNIYLSIKIKSIHNCVSENVISLRENESGSIGINIDNKNIYTKSMFKKGQIVTPDLNFAIQNTCRSFNCDVAIFNHHTTIRNKYQAMIHCGTIRQSAKFKISDNIVLRSGCKENIDVDFLQRSEFILPNSYFMFRDGRTKGMGKINTTKAFIGDKDYSRDRHRNKRNK